MRRFISPAIRDLVFALVTFVFAPSAGMRTTGLNLMKKIQLFAALTKVDEAKREVWGLATAEVVDKDGEIFDYASSKPYFEDWSAEISAATAGRSLGNVREMHRASAVGKLVDLEFDDENKTIAVGAKIVDDDAWVKCVEGVYTGFSIGGRYVNIWLDDAGEFLRFTAQPVEISVVDNPAVPNAYFTAIKSDGTSEVRKFVGKLPAASYQPPVQYEVAGDRLQGTGKVKIENAELEAGSRKLAAPTEEAMKEAKLEKAILQSDTSLEKIDAIDKKLESLEAGLKELADAFRKFSEGFAKSLVLPEKRVARTSVAVSKEDDGKHPAEGGRIHGIHERRGDADAGFLDAMKTAHANPTIGA